MNPEKPNNNEVERAPEAREIGEKILDSDYVAIEMFSGAVLVLEPEKVTPEGSVPADTWVQDIDVNGLITAEPRIGPPARMKVMTSAQFFSEIEKIIKEGE